MTSFVPMKIVIVRKMRRAGHDRMMIRGMRMGEEDSVRRRDGV
ncbi:hypothetical protein [Afipia sp. Root123D2]|nr:hypothetical protein [Afipia sp. Root123D2]